MFKIGDRVKIKLDCKSGYDITISGTEGIIVDRGEITETNRIWFHITKHPNTKLYIGKEYSIFIDDLIPVPNKKEPLTEIDFLNAFQENFKEGV